MVTYISSKNADQYRILFDKAAKALIANPPEGLGIDDTFTISTLNEYFAYLENLVKISNDEDISRFFVRLPLDEDFFEIDANSRSIKVPSTSFGRYGVGVQGDELAEVVYFTIDRYFDSTDLASDEINIVIQWEARDENRNTVAGISQHFGKDIETIPGKIIFGWPISSELTKSAGAVKFAVRFYQLGESDEQGVRKLNYNFSTLPAEVTVNASLNYDLVNHAVAEIDHGKIITSRIKNVGIYDPSIPIPEKPIVTIPLYVISPEGNELVKIVDLPDDGTSQVKLAISAKPGDIGVIGYDWKKFAYNPASGSYEADGVGISSVETDFAKVPYTATLDQNKEYYTVTYDEDDRVIDAALVSKTRIANIETDIEGETFTENGAPITLYQKLSVATVTTVGEYAVDITARAKVNTSIRSMEKAERIRIPGPLKPVVSLPEEESNITVTEDDGMVHAIAQNGGVTLKVSAVPGETGKPAAVVGEEPQVALTYKWKKVVGGVEQPLTGGTAGAIKVRILPVEDVPSDENIDDAQFNQGLLTLAQDGDNVVIYATNGELKTYESTNPSQGAHKWIALDIDTGFDTIVGATWNGYTLTQDDVDEAETVNLGAGHIIFWAKADALPVNVVIGEPAEDEETPGKQTTLRIGFSTTMPSNATYTFNGDNSEMTIVGLATEALDNSYIAEVISTRNKVQTSENSGIYRVTNAPEKPELLYGGAPVDTTIHALDKKDFRGNYRTLTFEINEPTLSDGITYLWMRAVVDHEADYDDYGQIKAQVDLDGALEAILGNTRYPGTRDTILNADVAHYNARGVIEFGESSGQRSYQLTAEDEGIYYCIVINELNNNKAASIGPFFRVS